MSIWLTYALDVYAFVPYSSEVKTLIIESKLLIMEIVFDLQGSIKNNILNWMREAFRSCSRGWLSLGIFIFIKCEN